MGGENFIEGQPNFQLFSSDGRPNAFVNSGLVLEDVFNSLIIFVDNS